MSEPHRTRLGPPSVGPGLAALATTLLDLVFPALCPVCRARLGPGRRDPLCGACWGAIARLAPPLCGVCGTPRAPLGSAPLPDEWGRAAPSGAVGVSERARPPCPTTCARCAAEPPAYDYARSAARYEGPLREALHAFKFAGRRTLARPLGALLIEECAAVLPPGIAAVVPVPLGWEREHARGFNQARLLAEPVAARLGVPLRPRWVVRTRSTPPQSDLPAEERRANVRGAFRASPAAAGLHVLVVDDVFTTGATLGECARALRAAGAARIGLLTVARVL